MIGTWQNRSSRLRLLQQSPASLDAHKLIQIEVIMRRRFLAIPVILLLLVPVLAQQADPSVLTVDSLFTYRRRSLGPVWWQANASGYLALEPSPTKKNFFDIVRYDAATGERSVKVAAEKLIPQG